MASNILSAQTTGWCDFLSVWLLLVMSPRFHRTPRSARHRTPSHHAVFALLWLDSSSAFRLRAALEEAGLHPRSLLSRFHLTVYHARRIVPGLRPERRTVSIDCDLGETRTMVLVPGGENPKRGVIPNEHSLALRLTTRNVAVPEIRALRAELTQLETDAVLGTRARSTARRNAFGARHYQPHVKICEPRNGASLNLTEFGRHLRAQLDIVRFDVYEVRTMRPARSPNVR